MKRGLIPYYLLLAGAIPGLSEVAAETLAGPVSAVVERVVDGDTIAVRARVWLGQDIHVLVRIRGIDAPELRGQCDAEKQRAALATDRIAEAVTAGVVTLFRVEGDKYHGRVVADVSLDDGRDLADLMLRSGTARAYDGGARGGWCVG